MALQNLSTAQITAIQAVWDKKLLEQASESLVYSTFGQTKTIPTGKTVTKATARRYKKMLPVTVPIGEYSGTARNPNKIVNETIEYEVHKFGDHVQYTEELDLLDWDNINASYTSRLAEQASLSEDGVIRREIENGTSVIYADGATDRAAVATGGKKLTLKDFRMAKLRLLNQGASKFTKVIATGSGYGSKAIKASFIGIAHDSMIDTLNQIPGWKDAIDYADRGSIMEYEEGSLDVFRFIGCQTAGIEDQGGVNVHKVVVFGKDAYASVSLRGKGGIEQIHKDIRSGGAADNPLNEFGSFGWKAWFGATILNQSWLIRMESTAELEDTSPKAQYDNS